MRYTNNKNVYISVYKTSIGAMAQFGSFLHFNKHENGQKYTSWSQGQGGGAIKKFQKIFFLLFFQVKKELLQQQKVRKVFTVPFNFELRLIYK